MAAERDAYGSESTKEPLLSTRPAALVLYLHLRRATSSLMSAVDLPSSSMLLSLYYLATFCLAANFVMVGSREAACIRSIRCNLNARTRYCPSIFLSSHLSRIHFRLDCQYILHTMSVNWLRHATKRLSPRRSSNEVGGGHKSCRRSSCKRFHDHLIAGSVNGQ